MFVYKLPKNDKKDPDYVFIGQKPEQIINTIKYYINRKVNLKYPSLEDIFKTEEKITINASPEYSSGKRIIIDLIPGVRLSYTDEHLPVLKNEISKAGLRGELYKVMTCPPNNYFVPEPIYSAMLNMLDVVSTPIEEGNTLFLRKK